MLERAQALLDLGRVEQARALAARVVAQSPHDQAACCLLAACHHAADDYPEMLSAAKQAVSADPADEWAHRLLAMAQFNLGQPDDALRNAHTAARLAPDSWRCHVLLAAMLSDIGRHRSASASCRRATRLAPDEAEPHYLQALLHHSVGLTWWAKRSYRRALGCDPQHAGALQGLAQVHARAGKVVLAASQFQATAAAAPSTTGLVWQLDKVMLRLPGMGVAVTLLVALVLTMGVAPLAWVVAAMLLFGYLAWALRVYRRLPSAARNRLVHLLRRDARFVVRAWGAGLNLLVAVGVGIASARSLSPENVDAAIFLSLLGVVLGTLLLLTIATVVADSWHRRRDSEPEVFDPADPPMSGSQNFLIFRWYRMSCLAAAVVWVPAVTEGTSYLLRAGLAGSTLASLVAYFVFSARRAARGSSRRDELWERFPNLLLAYSIGLIATVGLVAVTLAVPPAATDAHMLFAAFSVIAMVLAVVVQLVWLLVLVRHRTQRVGAGRRS